MILGVCEWLGYKFNIRPGALRLAFIVGAIIYGAGIGLYLILFLVKLMSDRD